VQHVLDLRRIMQEERKNNRSAGFNIVDFKKAFESLNRSKMIGIIGLKQIQERHPH